jgi:lactoylglutathione lyase
MRAFPVIYAKDVEAVAAFYTRLGFDERVRLDSPDGAAGFIGLERDGAEVAITTEDSPRLLAGVEPGPGPRHELFVYVEDVDGTTATLRDAGTAIVREPADMPWGERVGWVADPEGNLVSLARGAG